MIAISLIFAALLLLMSVFQVVFPVFFARLLKDRWTGDTSYSPHAAILLAVRGCDPSLRGSLAELLDQNYPSYEVHIVVDHQTDPAWDLIHQLADSHPKGHLLNIQVMDSPAPTRSLKCHSIIQCVEAVSDNVEVVVLVDADVTTRPDWLATAVAPLCDPEIGAVTGNQWFEPASQSSGTVLRSMWNAGAIISTVMYRNPWAGTCAMRLSDVKSSGLVDAWKESVVDDGPIKSCVASLGLKVRFEPALIMVNREDCSISYVARYISRMLTWSRLYEANFINTIIHASLTFAIISGAAILVVAGVATARFDVALISSGSLLFFSFATMAGYLMVRSAVNSALGDVDEKSSSLPFARTIQLIIYAPLIQLLYSISCLRAMVARTVLWRQIEYRIEGKEVRMLKYEPFRATQSEESFSI
ncbi:MAG: glycosyltransferase [Planctomycetota bacterium]